MKKVHALYCHACYWNLVGEVGMKPVCPDCGTRLVLITGDKEQIDKFIGMKRDKPLVN
jgi:predicted RNA-binding Zn-ribbon protein involved in translation (DUF1610 family)